MARQARKDRGDDELVQCEECKRWCYLDETHFASLADAEGLASRAGRVKDLRGLCGGWKGNGQPVWKSSKGS